MFKEMKNIMTESAKVIRETSDSLEQTLRVENVESGRTVSSPKETLGMAQELAKTLSEGKTHQHTQVPSRPPSKTSITTNVQPDPTPGCSRDDPEPTIEQKIISMMHNMDRDEYYGVVDLSKGFIQIKTEINRHYLTLAYNECKGVWSIRKDDASDILEDKLKEYLKLFMNTVKVKTLAEKPLACAMGWRVYVSLALITVDISEEQIWESYWRTIMRELPK